MSLKHPIDRLFEQKMADYAPTPSPNLWGRLESQLPQKKNTHKTKRILLLLLLLVFLATSTFLLLNLEETAYTSKNRKKSYLEVLGQSSENKTSPKAAIKDISAAKHSDKNSRIQKIEPAFAYSSNPDHIANKENVEKKLSSQATFAQQKASSIQKAKAEETIEKNVEKDTVSNIVQQKTDTLKTQENNKPKGTKIIIKLSEPEEPKESRARDFASTKAGKFLKKAKKIKNGEVNLPYFGVVLKN